MQLSRLRLIYKHKNMRNFILWLCCTWFFLSCGTVPSTTVPTAAFELVETIDLDSIAPIGLAFYKGQLWVSDGDNNRLVALRKDGTMEQIIVGFDRPMHLDSDQDYLYIPEYGRDSIRLLASNTPATYLAATPDLDAPSGISVLGKSIALADFYNHRVVYKDAQQQWQILGKKGKEQGEFHYPTDVQWTADELYVADAYNHRVQVFDRKGKYLRTIGVEDNINAATGIHVDNGRLAVTDFENSRVLLYTTAGKRLQVLDKELDQPTDVLFRDHALYVINYGSKTLQRYESELQ